MDQPLVTTRFTVKVQVTFPVINNLDLLELRCSPGSGRRYRGGCEATLLQSSDVTKHSMVRDEAEPQFLFVRFAGRSALHQCRAIVT